MRMQLNGDNFKLHCIRCGSTHFVKADYTNPKPDWWKCENCGLQFRKKTSGYHDKERERALETIEGSQLVFAIEDEYKTYNPLSDEKGAIEKTEELIGYVKANIPNLCHVEDGQCMTWGFATKCDDKQKCPLTFIDNLTDLKWFLKTIGKK